MKTEMQPQLLKRTHIQFNKYRFTPEQLDTLVSLAVGLNCDNSDSYEIELLFQTFKDFAIKQELNIDFSCVKQIDDFFTVLIN